MATKAQLKYWELLKERMKGNTRGFQKGNKVNLGRIKTEETRKKMSLARLGKRTKPHSEETKIKMSLAQKGRKGRPQSEEVKKKISLGLLGHKTSQETRDKIGVANKDEKHGMWEGEKAVYSSKHCWILRNYGNPTHCEDCGLIGKKGKRSWNIDWSNVDHKYRRKIEDYVGRCRSCHMKYDYKNNLRNKYVKIK